MIKIATPSDIDLIVKMAMEFAATTNYPIKEESVRTLVSTLVSQEHPESIIFLHGEDGMLAATANKFVFGTEYVATELAWWVAPDKRKSNIGSELLEAFEYWAYKIGCSKVVMVSLDDDIGKFYEKKGYSLVERAYMKDLK